MMSKKILWKAIATKKTPMQSLEKYELNEANYVDGNVNQQ